MFPIASASFKCIASTPFSASSLQPSHSQRLFRHSPPVERRRQHIAVVNGASDVNNVTDGGTSDSHRSFIERDANKSARVLQNQKPLRRRRLASDKQRRRKGAQLTQATVSNGNRRQHRRGHRQQPITCQQPQWILRP